MSISTRVLGGVLFFTLLPAGIQGQEPRATSSSGGGLLSLPEAAALALDHHPSVAVAEARREVAGGRVEQARAARLPSLYSDASLIQFQEPSLVAPLHGFDPTMAPEFDRRLVRGNLTLSYSLYDGGARASRIGQAESGEATAQAGASAARMDLIARVSGAYLDLLTTQELLEAAKNQKTALEAEAGRVRQFLAEGKAARVDLLRVEAALSQAQAVEISLLSRLGVARGRLVRLTGLSLADVGERSLSAVTLTTDREPTPTGVIQGAQAASPELEAARFQLMGASAGVREAKANWLPTLQAAGAYSDFGALDGGHTMEWQGSLKLSFPLFTGGARKGELHRAQAEERRASEALRGAELAVEEGAEEAFAALTETKALREALELGVEQTQEVARIEALALEVGSGVQTDFLRAQANLFQARASLVQARHGEVLATVQLARISGELTLSWLQENMEVVR